MGASSILNAFRRHVLGRREEETCSLPLIPRSENYSEQLVVHLANHKQPLRLEYRPEQTVRDVCEEIAKILDISPGALPFFTLAARSNRTEVLNQQKKLSKTECAQEYDFRLAFKACRASRFRQPDIKDLNVIKYLFHQSREEFLQDKIVFSLEREDQKHFVKLVVLELIYQSKQLDIKPQKLVDNAKQYKLLGLFKRGIFQQHDIREVKSYVKSLLTKFKDLSEESLMLDYLHEAEQSETFFVYTFTVYKQFRANGRNHNVEYELFISPQYGIKKRETGQSSQEPEVIVKDFSQVCDLKIDQNQCYQVIISRKESKAEVLSACSPQDAQSIVAIINGYYRLLVNRYKSLNALQTITPKFHGPISREMSMSILQARGEENGLFLIRQSRKQFGFHVLSLMYDKEIKHFEIIRETDNGLLMLKDTTYKREFKNLDAFVKYYKENKDGLPVCLKINCLPSDTANDALLNSYPLVPVTPRPQDLIQFGLESAINPKNIQLLRPIGKAGEFGNVFLSEWLQKEGENPLNIAVRKLKKKIYDKNFLEVANTLMQLKNINIIRLYGITQLKDSLGMVAEYALENLETYLKNAVSSQSEKKGISKKSVILFAAQIAEGMMYLKSMECVHGRLNAHNILVASEEQIKISDIGLKDLQCHGGEFIGVDRDSVGYCWHALEMLVDPTSKPTHESDVWSLGVTMWEMFALKRPFHTSISSKPLLREEILNRYHRDQYLSTRRDNLPEGVANVIKDCWKPCEEERISFANIVTALRDLIFKATPEESISYSHQLISEHKIEDWEKPIKKEKQQPIIKPLELVAAGDSYSMMAPNSEDNNLCTSCLTSPHEYVLYNTQGRKNSLQRTFSDPGSPKHIYQEPINENLLFLPHHKVSLTRTSSYPQSKLSAPNEEMLVFTNGSDKKKPRSFTQQAADSSLYHQTNTVVNIASNMPDGDNTDDKDNQIVSDSYIASDGEDKVMEFLKTEFSKASLKFEGIGNPHDLEKTNDHTEQHECAMDFLREIVQQKRIDSTTIGQYVPHGGAVRPLKPEDSTTGQYVPHASAVRPLKPDEEKNSFLNQGLEDFVNFHLWEYAKDPTVSPSQDDCRSGYIAGTQLHGHENHGCMEKRDLSGETTSDGISGGWFCNVNTAGCSKGYILTPTSTSTIPEHTREQEPVCEDAARLTAGCSKGYIQTPTNTLPIPEHPREQEPVCEDAARIAAGCGQGYIQTPTSTSTIPEHPREQEPVCEDAARLTAGCGQGYIQTPTNTSTIPEHPREQEPGPVSASLSEKMNQDRSSEIAEMRRKSFKKFEEKIDKDFKIEKANLRTMKEIGRGNFGVVRKGILTKYVKSVRLTEDVAVKQLKKCPDEKSQDDFITEAINMQELRKIKDDHIVTPIGICLDTENEDFMIITELAPLGDLPTYLKAKKERIGVHELLEFCLQIAKGMNSLERESVLHRDLALRNILVAAEDLLKISDFGLSRLSEYYKARDGKWPIKWYAPESLKHNRFTTKSDVWSYGVTVWEMFNYGELKPYAEVDNSEIPKYIEKGNRLPQPENCPDGVYDIMKQCWDEDCKNRPSFYLLYTDLIPKEIKKLTTE